MRIILAGCALSLALSPAALAASTTLPSSSWSLAVGSDSSTFSDASAFSGDSPQAESLVTANGAAGASVFAPEERQIPGVDLMSLGFQRLDSVGGTEASASGHIDFELSSGALYSIRAELRGVVDPSTLDYRLAIDNQEWTFADFAIEGNQYVLDAAGILGAGEHSLEWRYANWGANEGQGSVILLMKVPEPSSWLFGGLLIAGFGLRRL